jgi:hypothetical protein
VSIPTQESLPKPPLSGEGVVRWAERLTAFLTRNLPVLQLPTARASVVAGINSDIDTKNAGILHIVGTPGAPFSIGGFGGGGAGRILYVYNTTGEAMTLVDQSLASFVKNRLQLEYGDVTSLKAITLIYSDVLERWVVIATW